MHDIGELRWGCVRPEGEQKGNCNSLFPHRVPFRDPSAHVRPASLPTSPFSSRTDSFCSAFSCSIFLHDTYSNSFLMRSLLSTTFCDMNLACLRRCCSRRTASLALSPDSGGKNSNAAGFASTSFGERRDFLGGIGSTLEAQELFPELFPSFQPC